MIKKMIQKSVQRMYRRMKSIKMIINMWKDDKKEGVRKRKKILIVKSG